MTKDVLKQALDALETELSVDMTDGGAVGEAAEKMCDAITAIKKALAAHQWVGLTDEEIDKEAYDEPDYYTLQRAVRWAENRLKEKNA